MEIIAVLLLVILLSLIIGAIGIGCFLFGYLNGKKERSEPVQKENNSIKVTEENQEFIDSLAQFMNY